MKWFILWIQWFKYMNSYRGARGERELIVLGQSSWDIWWSVPKTLFVFVNHKHIKVIFVCDAQTSVPKLILCLWICKHIIGVVHANVGQNVTPHNPSLVLFLYHFLHTMVSWCHESIHNNTNNKQTPPPWWWSHLPLQRHGFDESTQYEWRATRWRGRAREPVDKIQ
jgi:hypothetical protein